MMRTEDAVALAGQATFMVVSPGTGAPQAGAFARRLREQLQNAQVSYGGQVLKIQASLGYATFGADRADSIEELMKRALQRLQSGTSASPAPSLLPAEVERAVHVLERLDAERLGDTAAREIVRRLAPFMQRALKRAS